MKTGFILNGEDISIEADEGDRLLDILRNVLHLNGTKCGCYMGNCGACSVLLNGEMVKSCLIPAFKIRGCEIITIEGFSQTDEYSDYEACILNNEFFNCEICSSGKILAMEALLNQNPKPLKEDILNAFTGIKCRCTSPSKLVDNVYSVMENRRRRLHVK